MQINTLKCTEFVLKVFFRIYFRLEIILKCVKICIVKIGKNKRLIR